MQRATLILGAVLAATRIVFLWSGTYLLGGTSGALQVPGYFMLLFALPESLLVRHLRNDPIEWQTWLSGLLVIGSFVWALLAVKVIRRLGDRG